MSRIIFESAHPVFKKWARAQVYGTGELYHAIMSQSGLLDQVYKPHPLLYHYSLQSIAHRNNAMKRRIRLCYENRHLVNTPGGGQISLDEVVLASPTITPDPTLPSILNLSAGLRGSYDKLPRVKLEYLLKAGHPRVLQYNPRGTSRTPLTSPELDLPHPRYNGVVDALDYINSAFPGERFVVVGDCTGSALGLNYFMNPRSYDHPNVVGGVFDSFQWDGLRFHSLQDDFMIFKLYSIFMFSVYLHMGLRAPSTKEVYQEFSDRLGPLRKDFENFSFKGSRKAVVDKFYDEYMSRLLPDVGPTPQAFHRENYCGGPGNSNFHRIRKPVVLIAAEDEPFNQPFTTTDVAQISENPYLALWLFAGGGHIAFLDGIRPASSFSPPVILESIKILAQSNIK